MVWMLALLVLVCIACGPLLGLVYLSLIDTYRSRGSSGSRSGQPRAPVPAVSGSEAPRGRRGAEAAATMAQGTPTAQVLQGPALSWTAPAPASEDSAPHLSAAAELAREREAFHTPALVVMSHNRPEYLLETLAHVLALDDLDAVTLYVSMDSPAAFGKMEAALRQAEAAASAHRPGAVAEVWHKPREASRPRERSKPLALIASHFFFALDKSLVEKGHSHAIVLEDDLRVAPDFITLFRAAAPLLAADDTLWCVSAWNDNGLAKAEASQTELSRTGFFPGLGWMVAGHEWRERLRTRWAEAAPGAMSTGWDYWVRFSGVVAGRDCLYPLVPRTRHVGKKGTNVRGKEAAFFDEFALSAQPAVPLAQPAGRRFSGGGRAGTLSGLAHPHFSEYLRRLVRGGPGGGEPAAPVLSVDEAEGRGWDFGGERVVVAFVREEYRRMARSLPLWPNHPRGMHRGALVLRRGHLVLLDRRLAGHLLDVDQRLDRRSDASLVAARGVNESCDLVCGREGALCDPAQLQFITDDCAALRQHFPCEAGCGHQIGREIPCYVDDVSRDTHQVCLVSAGDTPSLCNASFHATIRLCLCVPPSR